MLCAHLWEPPCPCSRVGTGSVSQVHGHQAEKVLVVLKHTVDVLLLKSCSLRANLHTVKFIFSNVQFHEFGQMYTAPHIYVCILNGFPIIKFTKRRGIIQLYLT